MSKIFFLFLVLMTGCIDSTNRKDKKSSPVYVSPSIDKYGRFRKGHVRMPVSKNKYAIRNRNRSNYYYNIRGKYSKKR